MSLKNFHIIFILVCLVLSAGFGFWCLGTEPGKSVEGSLFMGIASIAAAAGLVIYGLFFVKKAQKENL